MRHVQSRALAALLLLVTTSSPSFAKQRGPKNAASKAKTQAAATTGKAAATTTASDSEGQPADGATAAPAPAGTGKAPRVKVYQFTGLDVEGKLKTPQLLYFLNRVKAEFDTSTPDKRSFMPELERSADDKNL